MDVTIRYAVRNPAEAIERAKPVILNRLVELVQQTVDEFLAELGGYIGSSGTADKVDGVVDWQALTPAEGNDYKFWHESGELASEIVSGVVITDDGIRAFAGLPAEAASFQKALWNELGFTPNDGEFTRRALFMPLSEIHQEELQNRLRSAFTNNVIRIAI